MAAVDSTLRPTPPPSNDSADERFEHIKYSITTTPPQPRRSLRQPHNTSDKGSAADTSAAPTKAAHHTEMHKAEEERKQPPQPSKGEAGARDGHRPHDQEVDYSKEDSQPSCQDLHPSLHFIPEDKAHPPKEIHRSQQPATKKPHPPSLSPSPSDSPSTSPVSSPAPANSRNASPSASPSTSPNGGPRRLSQRQQKKALRAQLASHDDGDVNPQGHSLSKLQLLAPPPINSRRGGGGKGGASGSASPTPSPSPPPSPYLSPDHPKRRGSFASAINSVLPVHDMMAELAPNKVSRHPYFLYPALFTITLLVTMLVLRVPFTAPFSALLLAIRWLVTHLAITFALLAVALSVFMAMHRRGLYRVYRSVFFPPAGDSLPRPFLVESIDLKEERWQAKISIWAEQIDANSSIREAAVAASSPTDASPAPKKEVEGEVSFDGISGRNALALMECYQRGELDDCTFHCLRVYLADPSTNQTGDGDDTVAITFLSIKNHYDLSPYFLRLFTPIQACFPFLCAPALLSQTIRRWLSFRFCVIGFHWPFRHCVVFTKPLDAYKGYLQLDGRNLDSLTSTSDDAMRVHVARYVSVLQLARQFDSAQPKGQRSDFMLFPVLTSSNVVDAIPAAGGVALPILPTYVVDLRQFKGGEWQDYKRYLRKHNKRLREGPFEGAGGNTEVTEGADVSEQQAQGLVSLWWQVADYRGTKDQTVCLMEPNATYVQQLAHHPAKFIQMLALKLKDTTVAASLLFSLSPTLMTSDVAGFNYPELERAGKAANQQIKAYPVKLAAVLKQAIANGYEWVDFGPTTGASKMEIGAQEMPITGGLFYHGAATRFFVQLGAACLSRQHKVAKKAYE